MGLFSSKPAKSGGFFGTKANERRGPVASSPDVHPAGPLPGTAGSGGAAQTQAMLDYLTNPQKRTVGRPGRAW